MSSQLKLEVYAEIEDPEIKVEHEAFEKRISARISYPYYPGSENTIFLWMTDPQAAITMGHNIVTAGLRLAAQLGADLPDSLRSGPFEEYPVAVRIPSESDGNPESDDSAGPRAGIEER